MNEVKNVKKKISIYEGVLSVEELKIINEEGDVLPLSIFVNDSELDTLIKIANEYSLSMSLIGLFPYYDKCSDSDLVYFKLNSSKLVSVFESGEVSFEFIDSDDKRRNVNRIYSVCDDVRLEFVEKGRLLKKNIETVSLTDLVNSSISNCVLESECSKVR